tara:strand:- start:750 stop:1037 length:288 start_codon:yes stop_codon:yes gene_type:complete
LTKEKKMNLRDHGLNKDCVPVGTPRATLVSEGGKVAPVEDIICPNCSCPDLMNIQVEITNKMLTSGKGTGYYLGCPACPWASPMLAVGSSSGGEN